MTRTIRNLDLAEIETLVGWAATEGWNPGGADAPAFQAADPGGFFGAFVDGVMVAGIAAVAYDECFGFIGLYICHPDWRGQGHGKAVWTAAMAYLGTRTIGLDGVAAQQANYASMGFAGAHETVRMSGVLPRAATANAQLAQLDAIKALDRQCFPAPREGFLARWLAPPHRALMLTEADEVTAYAVQRSCRAGSKIGPLFARSPVAARAMLDCFSGPVEIDVPVTEPAWLETLKGLGFSHGFTTRRMYRGPKPAIDMGMVFGVTSLELG